MAAYRIGPRVFQQVQQLGSSVLLLIAANQEAGHIVERHGGDCSARGEEELDVCSVKGRDDINRFGYIEALLANRRGPETIGSY